MDFDANIWMHMYGYIFTCIGGWIWIYVGHKATCGGERGLRIGFGYMWAIYLHIWGVGFGYMWAIRLPVVVKED